ncbi:dyslexia-associated protein KIAA0319-like protein [Phlebotomus argentipes]|uniref:dyslexia-associated protein KIAA0319-like protein n=1 Tax=Phlebotomus argentipes TaxID=94469 RepID=UPI00289368EC|nr:dyslexia-associated protein KIAA0319-like protein [Phlebotomus argentipes]
MMGCSWQGQLAFALLLLLAQNGFCLTLNDDNCPQIFNYVFKGYTPIGIKAGNFSEHPNVRTLEECVQECCDHGSGCNSAFMFNGTCYHVKCASDQLCLPVRRYPNNTKLHMVLVNPVGDQPWLELLKQTYPQEFQFPADTIDDAKVHPYVPDKYELVDSIFNPQYNDEAAAGYGLERFVGEESQMDKVKVTICEVGVDSLCPKNERCRLVSAKSRQGFCDCLENFLRNEEGDCIAMRTTTDRQYYDKFWGVLNSEAGKIVPNVPNVPNAKPVTDGSTKQITVSVVSKDVRLPEKEVTLSAFTIPDEQSSGDKYKYLWTLVSRPSGDNGTISDQSKDKVKLSNLSEGLYQFKVTVTGSGSYGEANANVTVLPAKRINRPPVVVITPIQQTVKLPNSEAILDGSTSKDDDAIVSWHWDLVEGPIGYQPKLPDTATLQLSDLTAPGNYTFKLTVSDSDGVQNFTTANITVLKGIDYPPEANAGPDVILYLPHNNITLNGSLSTDDREIVAWEWTKDSTDESKAVDMQNTRTPYLQLSNLEEGIYKFVLKVTDASGQTSSATVHVFVKPPTNLPPIANAGKNITINLPQNWASLNASESRDDVKISSYHWRQISGPSTASIVNANATLANATVLTLGSYVFEVTVVDENGNNATDQVTVKVIQEKNSPPVANGGGDQNMVLPQTVMILNGSKSSDDLGIVNFTWTREGSSVAVGTIIGNTDHEAVLMVTDLVAGRYVFRLTVTDEQGLSSSDTVSVIVRPDPLLLNLVEVTLVTEATVLTENELTTICQKLELLLGDNRRLHVRELKMEQKTGQAIMVFFVENTENREGKLSLVPGLDVEKILKEKFWRDASILGSSLSDIRTSVCQNPCSDHGICNTETRSCSCETFWMPDVFYFWGISDANCDWSILYVIIGIFVLFLVLSGICWGITCMCRRTRSHSRSRSKPTKYSLLGSHDDELPPSRRGTVLSETDTDSDVLFSKQNGSTRLNGDARNSANKYSVTRLGRRVKT